jgi:2-methylaconitate cis-trans-isomerase PrpF
LVKNKEYKKMQKYVPCMIIRGGTSKGLYFLDRDLPPAGEDRDHVLLALMGSPDPRQIDGLGGAASVTSKAAILGPSDREDVDVEYTFAQVSIDKPVVSYAGNCGNISSGAGPFAIESGLIPAAGPLTRVRILNTNTHKILIEEVQTPGGRVNYQGDFAIPGVPGTAAPVKVLVEDPAGSVCGDLLPTGRAADTLEIPGFGLLRVSVVDAANPLVFVLAADIGMTGKESPADIEARSGLPELLEKIRGEAARKLGFIEKAEDSAWKSPTVPKMTIVAPPSGSASAAESASGPRVEAEGIDLLGRMMSMQRPHPTYALTGAMCTAAAAVIPGTIVYEVRRGDAAPGRLRIGHPGGVMEAGVDYREGPDGLSIRAVYGYRTARLLMKGTACYEDGKKS